MDYIEPREIGHINPIRQWIDEQPIKAGVKIDTRVLYLEVTEEWPGTYCKKLKGYKEIYELRIVFQSVQYRPLGFKGPGENEFTILIGAREKGTGRFDPPNAPTTAEERRKVILGDRRRIHEHEYRKEATTYEPPSE